MLLSGQSVVRGSKVEQFFYGKDPGTMNDGLVGMVYQHIAVGLVFLAEDNWRLRALS